MSDQSSGAVSKRLERSVRSSARAWSSSKSPPLNHETRSNPTMPPERIAPKRVRAWPSKSAGLAWHCSSIRRNMWPGSRPTSSANMQKTRRLMKCATVSAPCPPSLSRCATAAKRPAASSVSRWRVLRGRSRSGSRKAAARRSRVAPSARSSMSKACTSWTVLVQLVWIRNRVMSDTIRSGGFSSATAYCCSWAKARSRSFFGPLYSHAKHSRRQTSAQPSPPVVLPAPFSKANHSPFGSALIGSGMPTRAQRSLK